MTTSSKPNLLQRFLKDPFDTINSTDLNWHGFQFNILRDDKKLCKVLLELMVLIPLLFWVLTGSDSTIDQVAFFLFNIPRFIIGKISFNQLASYFTDYYGLGTHWSACVIYGLLFVGISTHIRNKLEIYNSENLSITTGFVGLAIATFEFFWQSSFYYFQNQHWILTFMFPQFRIILQNILFLLPGIIIILGLDYKRYKFNFEWRSWILLGVTIGLVLMYWYYPFPTETLTVEIKGYGTWSSSKLFPQTMYTIDTDLTDNKALCELFFIPNPSVHLVNNLTKIFWTLTFYNFCLIRKKGE